MRNSLACVASQPAVAVPCHFIVTYCPWEGGKKGRFRIPTIAGFVYVSEQRGLMGADLQAGTLAFDDPRPMVYLLLGLVFILE